MPATLHVNIENPCHENWQQMTPNEQGRHCQACQKTVVDFTAMSDQEILRYMKRATGKVCGRFSNHQLNRPLVADTSRSRFSFHYGWSLLVSGLLLGSQALAKPARHGVSTTWVITAIPTAIDLVTQDTTEKQTDTTGLEFVRGIVYHQGDTVPVSYASIFLKGTTIGTLTDEHGRFVLRSWKAGGPGIGAVGGRV